jgi:hypothetical protein
MHVGGIPKNTKGYLQVEENCCGGGIKEIEKEDAKSPMRACFVALWCPQRGTKHLAASQIATLDRKDDLRASAEKENT